MMPTIVWGSPGWWLAATGLFVASTLVVLWGYGRAQAGLPVRLVGAALKGAAFAALALCLVEPLLSGTRPRPGANAFAILVDNSGSLTIRDRGDDRSRGDRLRELLVGESEWRTRLGQDFDVRCYAFDSHLRAVDGFEALAFDGTGSAVGPALSALSRRFRGLPLAGVLLVTDGIRTDPGMPDLDGLPPVFPLLPRSRGVGRDVGVVAVSVSQTNFDAAPVIVRADVSATGLNWREPVVAVLLDEAGREVARQEGRPKADGLPVSFRFQFRPDRAGVSFYSVKAFGASEEEAILSGEEEGTSESFEQTLENNVRSVVVDRGGGPFRVLYASGRPNWEYKFLRRALEEDEQVDLVGLLRIARRQARFDFQAKGSRSASPLYDGFDNPDDETAERYDEAVLVRLNVADEFELRDGFPQAADDLYRYHAVIIDDLEADFFTADQRALIRDFVSVRGGGLLMLGGPDTFAAGGYDRTPVGDLLPVYLDRVPQGPAPSGEYRLVLTREGWLQPWVRTRTTEEDERQRLASMPPFHTLSRVGGLKPGAVVLAQVSDPSGAPSPALVAQQFGRGRVAALTVGDLWRWGLRRKDPSEDDFDRAWRQTVRWLVADVPERVELDAQPEPGGSPAVRLTARVRDPEFRPLDDAKVTLSVTTPDGSTLALDAEPDDREPGTYTTTYATRQPGPHRFVASAVAPDGSPLGDREAGWAAQPAADEFSRLDPDLAFAEDLANRTGGEVVDPNRLDAFVAGLSRRSAPITEPWTSPLWHRPLYFLAAAACLVLEWGLRRINGLA
ncbi:glutamine amidotransferase [Tautonia sociabilis]|uniref:Glutamine amidotransferase domain-containing protein n=1 Tax=Tautonia sociabilis TaxID=2080755 RepID=A0A432MIZ6_9BACT|nr:glutamine amidotransferase [Tautonia sociabilis]RUL87175.1 hypothetical protein TsocGM_13950 [Tautonia sociabilis]